MRRRRWTGAQVLAATIALATIPASASAEELYNQIDTTSPQSINSQDFNDANNAFDAMAVDDFVVPAGETWQLDSALVRGTKDGSTPATSADVKIFADASGVPGAEVFSGVATATGYPAMNLAFAGPALQAGTYWFGVSAILDPGPAPPFSQWYWAENSEPFGNPSMYRNPGDGFTTGCTGFTLKSSCNFPTGAPAGPHLAPSQSFSLSGTRTVTTPPVDPACTSAQAKLDTAKDKLKKAKAKLKAADGKAKDRAEAKVKKAKAKVKKAKAAVEEAC